MNTPRLRALVSLLLPLALATTARSQAALALKPAVGPPTAPFVVQGSGVPDGRLFDLKWDGVSFGSVVARNGAFEFPTTVPANAAPGLHQVDAIDPAGGRIQAFFLVRTDWLQFGLRASLGRNNRLENQLGTRQVPGLQEQWRTPTRGAVNGAPILYRGRLYVSSTDGSLYCLDPKTGQQQWKVFFGRGLTATPVGVTLNPASLYGFNPQPEPPPLVLVAHLGGTAAVDAKSGQVLWQAFTGPVVQDPLTLLGFNPQPEPPPRHIVASESGQVYALRDDGSTAWMTDLGAAPSAAPSAWMAGPASGSRSLGDGAQVLVGTVQGELFQLDALTGAIQWKRPLRGAPGPVAAVMDPAGAGMLGLVGDASGMLWALRLEGGAVQWMYATRGAITTAPALGDAMRREAAVIVTSGDGNAYGFADLHSGVPSWVASTRVSLNSSPAIANGVAYFGADDGMLRAVDASNGRLLYQSGALGPSLSSPIVADGMVFFGTQSGYVVAMQ